MPEPRASDRSFRTGAFTAEVKARRDRLYESNHRSDPLIIGTGMAALTVAALLAERAARLHAVRIVP